MLRIKSGQVAVMAENSATTFEADTVAFLRERRPEWSGGRSDAEISSHLAATKKFADAHDIHQAASLQRLALMKIDKEFGDRHDEFPNMLLRAKGWSEIRRIQEFDAARRAKNPPKPVQIARQNS